jgi:hypothetical protein
VTRASTGNADPVAGGLARCSFVVINGSDTSMRRTADDVDLAMVRRLLLIDKLPPKTAARQLGVTVEHIRHALQRPHRPPNPEPVRRRRAEASDLLTMRTPDRPTGDGQDR